MNSINETDNSLQVRRVFFREILPSSIKMKISEKMFFQVTAEPDLETYYIDRNHRKMAPEDFEVVGCDSAENLAVALVKLWESQGYPELCPLGDSLSKLAKSLHFVKEQSEEVSPFIYVMF